MKRKLFFGLLIIALVALPLFTACGEGVATTPPTTTTPPPTTPPPTTPPPTTPPPTTPTTPNISIIEGDWISNETNLGPVWGPILEFTVSDGQIVSLTVSVLPIPTEWFLWFIDEPLDIQGNRFTCSTSSLPPSSGQGEFVLEGEFTAPNQCEGTMKFPEGFYWVDFELDHDVTFTWTAQPE